MKKLISIILIALTIVSCKKANQPTTLTFKIDHLVNLRTPYIDLESTKNIRSAKYTIVIFEGNTNTIRTKRTDKIYDNSIEFDIKANVGDRVEICIVLPIGFDKCDRGCLRYLECGSMVSSVNTDDALNTMTSVVK